MSAVSFLQGSIVSDRVRLVHGNAGTVAQGWRTDTYRALSSGASDQIHVLTVDYRGFGYSSGTPTEQGLITDGVALVNWALDVAKIPPERIVIFGQSLGTAVSVAVAEHFALNSEIEFAGIILVAGFSDIPTLMLSYYVGGILPILAPLRPYPWIQRFFADRIQETWFTARRLENLVRHSNYLRLNIIHATNDFDIPWSHSDTLFHAAANATVQGGMTIKQINAAKSLRDSGEAGRVSTWTAASPRNDGMIRIRQEIVQSGGRQLNNPLSNVKKMNLINWLAGHNRLPTYAVAAKAVLRAFDL